MKPARDNFLTTQSTTLQGVGIGIVFVCLALLSFDLGYFRLDLTFLPIIVVFLWPRREGRYLDIWGVMLIGLALDLLTGGPIGLFALTLMIMSFVVRPSLSELSTNWGYRWIAFLPFLLASGVLIFVLARLSLGAWPPIAPLVNQLFWTFVLFPFVIGVRSLTQSFRPGAV